MNRKEDKCRIEVQGEMTAAVSYTHLDVYKRQVVTYGNLNEVKVKQDDRILKEAVLGTADSYVTINALKDNEKIKVSDAFS